MSFSLTLCLAEVWNQLNKLRNICHDSLCDSVTCYYLLGGKQNTQSTSKYKITEQCKSIATLQLAWRFAGYPQTCICSTETVQSFASLCVPFFVLLSELFDTETVVSYDFCSLQWFENSIKTEASCFLWQFLSALGVSLSFLFLSFHGISHLLGHNSWGEFSQL